MSMLLNSFFEIKEKTNTESGDKVNISARLILNKSHPIFEGHFPNQPVVPGVCMIQMVMEILEKHLDTKLFLSTASNIKFLSVINPEVNNQLNADIQFKPSPSFEVEAKLFWEEIIFFKIKGIFSASLP